MILSIINKENELYTCSINLKNKKTYLNRFSDFSVGNLNLPISITDRGQIVSYFNADMYSNYENDKQIPESMKKELQNGAYIICLQKLNASFFIEK